MIVIMMKKAGSHLKTIRMPAKRKKETVNVMNAAFTRVPTIFMDAVAWVCSSAQLL